MSEKLIEVKNDHRHTFRNGEAVTLVMSQSMGNKAVVLGYLIPFILVLATLLIASRFTGELVAGLISVAILVPYYLLLAMFRDRLSNTFIFRIEPFNRDMPDECLSGNQP